MFNGFKRKKEFLEKEKSTTMIPKINDFKDEQSEKKVTKVKKARTSEKLEENNKEIK